METNSILKDEDRTGTMLFEEEVSISFIKYKFCKFMLILRMQVVSADFVYCLSNVWGFYAINETHGDFVDISSNTRGFYVLPGNV